MLEFCFKFLVWGVHGICLVYGVGGFGEMDYTDEEEFQIQGGAFMSQLNTTLLKVDLYVISTCVM